MPNTPPPLSAERPYSLTGLLEKRYPNAEINTISIEGSKVEYHEDEKKWTVVPVEE